MVVLSPGAKSRLNLTPSCAFDLLALITCDSDLIALASRVFRSSLNLATSLYTELSLPASWSIGSRVRSITFAAAVVESSSGCVLLKSLMSSLSRSFIPLVLAMRLTFATLAGSFGSKWDALVRQCNTSPFTLFLAAIAFASRLEALVPFMLHP